MPELFSDRSKCFGCEACSACCPSGAIKMVADAEGFAYPVIDAALCTECGRCVDVCPAGKGVSPCEQHFFAVRTLSEDVLYKSTSGGAFSLIADAILKIGGIVCGAVYDEDFNVVHVVSEDIAPMRKPKYVQSSLGGCYDQLSTAVKDGRPVLFTGTPCQCDAVRSYFGDDSSIYYAALVCRGVGSPALWKDYVKFLEKNGPLTSYCSRDKRRADDAHTVAYIVGGSEMTVQYLSDPFSRIYAKELSLRPSCYQCPYATIDKTFDFVIGDFWGVEKAFPELADGRGTSLVITGSARSYQMILSMKESAVILETDREHVKQPALEIPAKAGMLRRFLMKDIAAKGPDGICDIAAILKKYGS